MVHSMSAFSCAACYLCPYAACCGVLLLVDFESCLQAQKAQQLHDDKVAMARTLAENDANIKAKKQAAKQQVGLLMPRCCCSAAVSQVKPSLRVADIMFTQTV